MNQPDVATAARKILFVDDAQIASMDGVARRVHPARKHEGNPVVTSDRDWEAPAILLGTVRKEGERYRMWYQSQATVPSANGFDSDVRFLHLYAESEDGLAWTKPALGLYENSLGSFENNIAFVRTAITKDMNPNVLHTPDLPGGHPYTMLTYGSGYGVPYNGYFQAFSEDGINWTDGPQTPVIPGYGDVGWFTYDEQDRLLRGAVTWDRSPGQVLTRSEDGQEWTLPWPAIVPDDPAVVANDEEDQWARDHPDGTNAFHGMPFFRYGPVLLGFLQVLRGHEVPGQGLDAEVDVHLMSSRDGSNWERVGDRRPVLEQGAEGSWDSGLVWTGNSLVADGDRVVAYYTGCERRPGALNRTSWAKSIGMAWWPKDRFVGLASVGDGVVVTERGPSDGELHVNADASKGSVTAELLQEDGSTVDGFAGENCVPLKGEDSLGHRFQWRDAGSDSEYGHTTAIRLRLRNAEVFSLWWE